MKNTLQTGIAASREFPIDASRTIDFMGEDARVYATPMLVRDIEVTCRDLLLEHLEPGEDTVGTRVVIELPDGHFPDGMCVGADGTLYVVDMYRGVIQHARFLTDHLRDYILERDLHIPVGKFGRIYRIVREDREIETNTPRFSQLKPADVVEYLRHENGFLRDQAQQILVQWSPAGVVSALEEMVKNRNGSEKDQPRLHALWSLEGFNRSAYAKDRLIGIALQALEDSHPRIRAAAIRILEPEIMQNSKNVLNRLEKRIVSESSSFVQLQLLASLGESGSDASLKPIADLLNKHAEDPYFREMALTGVYKREKQFADLLRNGYGWNNDRSDETSEFLAKLDNAETADNNREPLAALTGVQRRLYENGNRMYVSCSACHGTEGEGVSGIGPALAGSHWVQEDPEAIHDYRVALRRLRSLLRVLRPWLPQVPGGTRRRLRRLMRATNESRNLEVLVAWIGDQMGALTPRQQIGVTWFVARLRLRRANAEQRMLGRIERRSPRLRTEVRQAVAGDPAGSGPSNSPLAGAVVRQLLRRETADLEARLGEIETLADRSEIHAARIAAKRLRYLLEPFTREIRGTSAIVDRLREVQDLLGAVTDAHTGADEIRLALIEAGTERARRTGHDLLPWPALDGASQEPPAPPAEARAGLIALARRLRADGESAFGQLETWMRESQEEFLRSARALATGIATRRSGRPDLNRRLPAPKAGALPG